MNTSSKGPLFLVLGKSLGFELSRGVGSCVPMRTCVNSSVKNWCVCGFRFVKSTGCRVVSENIACTIVTEERTLSIARVHASFAIHHAYALATFLERVLEILPTSKLATSSFRFFNTSVPPTPVSPRSRKKSHKQNCRVMVYEWEVLQSCWATKA